MRKVFVFVLLIIVMIASGCTKSSTPSMDYAGAQDIAYALQDKLARDAENTDTMVDAIYAFAKDDAENITPELTDQALAYLAVNFAEDPFGGNLVMESCMYFGALLDNAYDDSDTRSEVGWDAYRAIKYVYRGQETISDAQPAFDQTINGLVELGYLKRK